MQLSRKVLSAGASCRGKGKLPSRLSSLRRGKGRAEQPTNQMMERESMPHRRVFPRGKDRSARAPILQRRKRHSAGDLSRAVKRDGCYRHSRSPFSGKREAPGPRFPLPMRKSVLLEGRPAPLACRTDAASRART